MIKYCKFLLVLFGMLAVAAPAAYANGTPFTQGWSIVQCPSPPCLELCPLVHTGQHIVQGIVAAAIPIALIVILYGAFLLIVSGGNEQRVTAGKNAIRLAGIGLLVALGSWIIVNTLFIAFAPGGTTGAKPFPWPWTQIQCS